MEKVHSTMERLMYAVRREKKKRSASEALKCSVCIHLLIMTQPTMEMCRSLMTANKFRFLSLRCNRSMSRETEDGILDVAKYRSHEGEIIKERGLDLKISFEKATAV